MANTMSPTAQMGAMMGGAQAGAGLGNMFAPWSNPADAASPYLGAIPGAIAPYYNPYIQTGQNALGGYYGEANKLTSNPGGFVNEVGKGYQESPGMEYQMNKAMQAQTNAAAAGGYAGTPQHEQYSMELANDIASQDYYKYLASALGMYGQGYQGLGNTAQMGLGATNQLTQALMDTLMAQAELAYKGEQAENEHEGGGWGSLLGGLGTAGMALAFL